MRLKLSACLLMLAAVASFNPPAQPSAHTLAASRVLPAGPAWGERRRAHHADLIGAASHSKSAEALDLSPLSRAKKYVCPPCGCGSDGKEFDKPGTCLSCEMELVEVVPDAAAAAASATETQAVVVKSPYAVEPPPSQNVTAGYMTVENRGDSEVALASAASEVASAVELHAMETAGDGMMRMRKVERINVPAKGSVELKPGGLHLMLIGLRREIKDGEEVTVTLLFSDSTKKTVRVPVRKRPAA